MVFTIQLLGSENANSKMLYLLHGLFLKNEKIFTTMFQDPLQETINLLELLLIRMDKLEEIFPNKTTIKKHKLVKN